MVTTPLAAPTFTLRTVTSGGALNEFLPDYGQLTLSPIFNEAGTVTFTYPANGKNFALLVDDAEIAVLVNGVEALNLRCIIEAIEGNDADDAEGGALWTYTARTVQAVLERAVVYPQHWPFPIPATFTFTSATPGKILTDLIGRAQTRGALTGITYDFSDTVDSNGVAWTASSLRDYVFDAGTKLSGVATQLIDGGACEVRSRGRVIQAFNVNTLGTDLTTGTTPLKFVKGRDVSEAPRKSTTRELATTILLGGSNGTYVERTSTAGIMTTWGRRESSYSANNIPTSGILDLLGDWILSTTQRPTKEITHGLIFSTADNPRPISSFDVGDWSYSDVGKGWEKYRIKQWTISVDGDKIDGSVILNDLLTERIAKTQRLIDAFSNGSSSNGSSTEKDDGLAPAAPGTATASSTSYLVNSIVRAGLIMSWAAVTTNSDGSAATDIDSYVARWKYSTDTAWRATQRVDVADTTAYFGDLDPNKTINYQVKAVDRYNRSGAYTSGTPITSAGDTTAPPVPSIPIVTSVVGSLRVVWNGKDNTGTAMPADFAGVEVHLGPNGTFTPTTSTLVDTLSIGPVGTTINSTTLVFNTEYWIRLVAFDTSGNKSAGSAENSTSHAVLKQVVSTDIGGNVIDFSNIRFKDIGNMVPDGSFELATTSALINGLSSVYGIDVVTNPDGATAIPSPNVLAFDLGGNGSLYKIAASINCAPGQKLTTIFSWKAVNLAGSDVADLVLGFNRIDGTVSYTNVKQWDSTTNNSSWTLRTAVVTTAPANTVSVDIMTKSVISSGSTAFVYVDQWEVRFQTPTALIEDAAITNAKIGSLAVNDANIANVSAGKLTVGTLTADITLSARIKTADTGTRVEINSGGIGAWDSGGTQTIAIASSNGSVKILGNLISGTSGKRIDISPFGTGLPEIRFYPTSGSNYGFLNAAGSGSDVSIGLNSGSFTANSQTCEYRLFMTPSATSLEMVNTSAQVQNGPGLYMYDTQASMQVKNSGSERQGFVDVFSGGNGTAVSSAVIGHNGASDSVDAWLEVLADGTFNIIGSFNRDQGFSNGALQCGSFNMSSAVAGVTISWGLTMISTVIPQVNLRDNSYPGLAVDALSTTGFGVGFSANTVGSSAINWWAWR